MNSILQTKVNKSINIVKVADVKRPSQYALKLPSKTGHT